VDPVQLAGQELPSASCIAEPGEGRDGDRVHDPGVSFR
jgi:hypothetical protein